MLNLITLSVIKLSVVILSVVILKVVAPLRLPSLANAAAVGQGLSCQSAVVWAVVVAPLSSIKFKKGGDEV
jgi:hypothetical protein